MTTDLGNRVEKRSLWQLVFTQSKVNGAPYYGEQLPAWSWDWPMNTYLQRRLQYLRWHRSTEEAAVS